ncbi:DoxX family protein [Deinococcus sp.]|uniref:DoxX family protein n=1 Tax=Deinococcus sp. TaxID=47478 RepID=UPI0025BB2BC7|nr:DoxX family protein [Deinococcus sp.]
MTRQPELALALLRLMLGAMFALHGAQAIFYRGLGPTTAQFKGWHVPMPLLTAPLVATLELTGGILIFLGLGARPFAFALAVVMGAAICYAHWGKDFFRGGMEVPLILLVCALAIALGGPGKPSFDQMSGEVVGPPQKPQPSGPPPASKRVAAKKKSGD